MSARPTPLRVVLAALVTLGVGRVLAAGVAVTVCDQAGAPVDADLSYAVRAYVGRALSDRVTMVPAGRVAEVLSTMPASGLDRKETARAIGERLGVECVLTVAVSRGNNKEVRLAATLLEVATGQESAGPVVSGVPGTLRRTVQRLAEECDRSGLLRATLPLHRVAHPSHLAAERHFLEAVDRRRSGEHRAAILECLKVVESVPDHASARLMLAECYLATGDIEEARVTLHRTLALLPETRMSPRVQALLDQTDPEVFHATRHQDLAVSLPSAWPKGDQILYELRWKGEVVRRDTVKAVGAVVTIEMPDARAPLDLDLLMARRGVEVVRKVRLWPAPPDVRPPRGPLVVVDPAQELAPLMKTVEHRVYRSCEHMPDTPCRVVVAPQATKALSADSVRSINGFVNRGGEVVVLGCAASDPPSDVRGGKAGAKAVPEAVTAPEWELAGIRPMAGRWPMAATWRADPAAPVFAYLSAEDLVAALRGQEQVNLLRGGNRRLSTLEGDLSLISASEHGKLLWVAWPLEWDASDPRCVRLVAMALSESLFGPLRP